MATVRVEWAELGNGYDGVGANMPRARVGTPVKVTVTTTATASDSRPTVPNGARWALVKSLDGNVIVESGVDPTATQNNGALVMAGGVWPEPVRPGDKLSFVEMT